MIDVTLTIHTPEGSREVPFAGDRVTIGRTDAATVAINDDGLSRLHASLHREGDRVWILDEASTNGSYVNGQLVPPMGAPLADGDEILIGNHTTITVNIRSAAAAAHAPPAYAAGPYAPPRAGSSWGAPHYAALSAIIIVFLAVIGIAAYGLRGDSSNRNNNQPGNFANNWPSPTPEAAPTISNNSTDFPSASPSPGASPGMGFNQTENTNSAPPPQINTSGRTYHSMSREEQRAFVEQQAQRIAGMIGNREGNRFTPEALARIQADVNAYASRIRAPMPAPGRCGFGQNLAFTLQRASRYAPHIVRSFNQLDVPPVVGLYLAMIESEYCICLQSPTGPLGMFQFTQATGRTYGLRIVPGSTPSNPDERCEPSAAAVAAAKYVKALMARYGTGPLSVPLSIASYNSGEGGLSSNLQNALDAARNSENPERSFWTLVANSERLSDQFQRENIRYVPKFFGAAIVGENPRVFGVQMEPLSSYIE